MAHRFLPARSRVHNLGRNTAVFGSIEAVCGAGAIFPQKTGELLGFAAVRQKR
jgi:hypothetical protein